MKIFNFITHTHNKYTKKVAILIPYYNNSKTISTPLKSFLKLKYPHKLLKIIICDDCSNIEGECEKLNEIVQGYKKHFDITIYQNKTNVGSALNRAALFNHLLKEKDIEYFAYVDADDKLKPKFFNCCFDVQIKNDYKYDVVCAFKIRSKFGHKKIANFLKLDTWSLWGKLYKTSWYASTFYSTKIANYTEDLTF
jgi:glycosyltransferase involved in cell wall biosynthesis